MNDHGDKLTDAEREMLGHSFGAGVSEERFQFTLQAARVEISAAKRRRRTLRVAVACAVLAGAGGWTASALMKNECGGNACAAIAKTATVCPHGASNPKAVLENQRLPKDFLQVPDQYQRICYCQPSGSGSLRKTR